MFTIEPNTNTRTSRLAIASLVLSIFSLCTFLVTAALSIALGITALCRIKKHKAELKGKALAITAITISGISILVFAAFFVLWSIDAAPIPDDYTIADLRSAPPECAQSYELLITLNEEEECPADAPAIGLSEQDVNTIYQINDVIKEGGYPGITEVIKANADGINQAWQNGKKGRDIISMLDTFPEIADLTEPNMEAEIGFLNNLRRLVYLYQAYIYLQVEQGNSKEAVSELIKLDLVFRMLSVNARPLITKLVCFSVLNVDIRTATFIVNNSQTSQKSIKLLAEHFTLLTDEQISLRNSIISEYLIFKLAFKTTLNQRGMQNNPMLKRNSSFRLYRNFCDNWIGVTEESQESRNSELSVWPSICPDWVPVSIDSDGQLPWFYTCYNPIGSMLVQILTPAMEKIFEHKTKLEVQNDLFRIVLNKRLGNEVSLKAHAYSDEYIIDVENKKIFSPGPDGKSHTEDDIKLQINPEVLGLVSQ